MAGGLKPERTAEKMAFPRRITRRQWMLDCARLLALGAVGCGRRDRARAKHSTLTVLTPGDEWILGPDRGEPLQFLVFLPLTSKNAKGELEGRLAQSWDDSSLCRSSRQTYL